MLNYIFKKNTADSERTLIIKKNILGSFVAKGLNVLVCFLLVPFTISILNNEKYGIWITIFSIVNWFNIMDIGLGNGFRNKFAETIANKNYSKGKEYVQTLYSSTFLISSIFLILFLCVNFYLDWYKILNVNPDISENLNTIVLVVFVLFCFQLVLKNISTILLAIQKTAFSNVLVLLGNVISFLVIILINYFFKINLFIVAFVFMLSPIIVYFLATFIVFKEELKEYKPSFEIIPKRNSFNELMTLGLKFFLIQITSIIIFSSSSILITRLYGPSSVTSYNIAFQLFAAAQIVFTIIVTPFWTAFTDANSNEDYTWIKNSIKNLLKLWILFSIGVLVLWLISPIVFKIWIGNKVSIPFQLSFQFALYTILITGISIFSAFIAGIGKIQLTLIVSIIQCIVYIPLAYFLAKMMNLHTIGVIMAININMFVTLISCFIQTRKLISKKAFGIWNK
ncbi:MATE family efflux transporter [Flavobacterium facile]|uniref:MATE family efflux transporter n=1 Tax=Flavobacterium facile TaxID=2893174 RepID=UPI002E76C621|nr:MATE family efflux transporter [Flavobacterium sp. T-12]